MHKSKLNEDECCFFKFPYPDYLSFWNKNVAFDINVIFIDDNFNIINISELKAGQEKPVSSEEPATYVVEIISENFEKIINFKKINIIKDNFIEFLNNNHKSNFSGNDDFQKIANTVYKTVR